MKNLSMVAGRALGLIMVVLGLNGLLHFLPQPPPATPEALAFIMALATTKGFWLLLKGTEIVAGLTLLTNRWAALGLVVLAPVTVNIVLYHTALDPSGLVVALAVAGLHLAAAWNYRDAYKALLKA